MACLLCPLQSSHTNRDSVLTTLLLLAIGFRPLEKQIDLVKNFINKCDEVSFLDTLLKVKIAFKIQFRIFPPHLCATIHVLPSYVANKTNQIDVGAHFTKVPCGIEVAGVLSSFIVPKRVLYVLDCASTVHLVAKVEPSVKNEQVLLIQNKEKFYY